MVDDTIASIIALHQPKRARTGVQRARAYRPRKRPKAKAAPSPDADSQSYESLIPVDFSSANSALQIAPHAGPDRQVARRHAVAPRRLHSPGGRGVRARRCRHHHERLVRPIAGSSDIAGWLFLAIGVAADLAALVLPSCAAGLWHTRQRATSLAGWAVLAMTFAFAITAGIGFASVNITDVTAARAARVTPAVTAAQSALSDAMSARDRECERGVGKFCREREAAVAERRRILDTAMVSVGQTADPQNDAAIKLVAWVTHGVLRPSGDDFAMLRLVLLAMLPQIGGILLMVSRSAMRPSAS